MKTVLPLSTRLTWSRAYPSSERISMYDATDSALLKQFLADGRVASLTAYARQAHPGDRGFEAVAQGMAHLLEPVAMGEQPVYESLETAAFLRHPEPTGHILTAMLASPQANLKECAIRFMGQLGWPEFVALLEPLLEFRLKATEAWQPIAALRALAQFKSRHALELLERAAQSTNDEVRAEAQRLLSTLRDTKAPT